MSRRDRLLQWVERSVPAGNIVARTVKSGMWVSATNVGDRLLQIVLLVILASMLGPEAFGLLGIALVTVNALERFSRLGFSEALIQQKAENVDAYLNTAWSMQAMRGAVLAAITFLAAPLVASVFSEPRAIPVLRVIALSPLLNGLQNPGIVYFRKNLEFHKQFVYQLSGSILNFVVALGIAFFVVQSVWALILGYVLADVTRLVVSYLLHDHRPRPQLDLEFARELFGYGKWITGSGAVLFLINEGDDALVGVLLSATALGLYQTGYRLGKAPSREITQIISSVLFPTYSKLQEDMDALRRAFFQVIRVTTLISFPIGVGVAVVADPFVRAFMGEAWVEMIPTLQLIAAYGLLVSFAATFGPVFKALGRPDYLTKVGLLRLVLMGAVVVPAIRTYGITGMAAVVVGIYLFAIFPIDVYLVANLIETTSARILSEIAYPLVASIAMGAVVALVGRNLSLAPRWSFGIMVAVGVVVYVVAVAVLETRFGWGLERDFRRVLNAVQG